MRLSFADGSWYAAHRDSAGTRPSCLRCILRTRSRVPGASVSQDETVRESGGQVRRVKINIAHAPDSGLRSKRMNGARRCTRKFADEISRSHFVIFNKPPRNGDDESFSIQFRPTGTAILLVVVPSEVVPGIQI